MAAPIAALVAAWGADALVLHDPPPSGSLDRPCLCCLGVSIVPRGCWVTACKYSWQGKVNLKARVDLGLPTALRGWHSLEPAFLPMPLLQSMAGASEAASKAPSTVL